MGERHPEAHVKRFAGLSLIALICSNAAAIFVAVVSIMKNICDKYSASRAVGQINLSLSEAQPVFTENKSSVKGAKKTVIIAAGGAVVSVDGRVLMMLRRGMWDLPKGHLEAGETLPECAAREVCEECGLEPTRLTVGEEIARTVHSYVSASGRPEEKYTTWFRMTYSGDPSAVVPQTEEDITALEWFSPEEARRRAATSFETIQEVIEKLTASLRT